MKMRKTVQKTVQKKRKTVQKSLILTGLCLKGDYLYNVKKVVNRRKVVNM